MTEGIAEEVVVITDASSGLGAARTIWSACDGLLSYLHKRHAATTH
ncbi:hypothetical protein [Sinorhizobium meliloti]|nr:hypothetical protein [Sinorhizobium meliloti]QQF06196.1 hypothetical protein JFX10_25395 [Sinorhizobium meliloti]